jgi:hypothetical protein
MDDLSQEPSQDAFEVEDSESAPPTRLSPRARARRVALAAGAFLVLAVVIGGSLPNVRGQIAGLVQRFIPTPTPPLPPGADRFYIETDVPWTAVSLDGHPIALPRIGVDAPLRLARGRHLLAWNAAPFQPQQCSIDVPDTTSASSCFIIDQVRQGHSGPLAQVVALGESLVTLSADTWHLLIRATVAALSDFSEAVQPGETYFTEPGGDAIASQPLHATLNMQVQTDDTTGPVCLVTFLDGGNSDCTIGDEVCNTFCTLPWQYRQAQTSASDRQEWLVFGVIYSSWDYTDANSLPVASAQPIDAGRAAAASQLVLLRITWDGAAWQVQPLFGPEQGTPIILYNVQVADDPACLPAEDQFSQYYLDGYARIRFVSGPNPAAGCLIEATPGAPPATPAADAPVEEYLLRFGELIAVNNLAQQHTGYHLLPDAYEQLAQQLAALPGGLTATS